MSYLLTNISVCVCVYIYARACVRVCGGGKGTNIGHTNNAKMYNPRVSSVELDAVQNSAA